MFMKDDVKNIEILLSKFNVTEMLKSSETYFEKIIALLQSEKVNDNDAYIETKYQNAILQNMLQTIAVCDFCLVGSSGCGKTMLVNKIGKILGRDIENIVLYQDMTSRDLLQQRTTLENGDTGWRFSPLVEAAIEGRIAVLDGIDRIHPSTLSILHRSDESYV